MELSSSGVYDIVIRRDHRGRSLYDLRRLRSIGGCCSSYRFEVCSAGLERVLKRPSDFERYLGEPILVKLYRPKNGQKEFPCRLLSYHDGDVTAEMGGRELTFEKAEIALVRLRVEF